jgi:DHA2 family multidrug resistance protein
LERGEAEDWLSSESIRICATIAVVGLLAFILYELNIKQPAVNLKLLGNKNLAVTTIFTFVAGFGLFTSVFVYPVLTQRVLGFTAFETGNSLLLPTLAAVILMPIIGKMMSKGVTPIPLIIIGFILFSAYAFMSANVSLDVGKQDFFIPLLIRAVGISLCQLPLINQVVAGLEPKDYPTAISLNNMIRQLGGAFGIAVANNYVASRYAQHRSDIVSNMPAGSSLLNDRVQTISQGIISKTGDFAGATTKAYATLNGIVDRQAYYLSYLDSFRLIGVFFLIVIPLVVFLRAKKKTGVEAAVAMKAASESH